MDAKPKTSNTIQTLYSYDTELCADSIEWCPHEPHQNIFVCGIYHLVISDEQKQIKVGRILLFSIAAEKELKLIQTLTTAAVLDQKWCHNKVNGHSVLGVVNAEKRIEVYKLSYNVNNIQNVKLEILTHHVITDDTSILSLDWSTGKYKSESPQIICSDSKGNIHRLKLESKTLELCNTWNAHKFEAWIVAFYYWDTNIVFTGGDDSLFLQFDDRVGDLPIFKNKSHQAGVTSIHSNPQSEFLLATGSYDSYLRLWDIRNMKTSKYELEMPGTLWRLKWNPNNFQLLLAACMLGGVHIVDVNNVNNVKIVESYYEHENISYGADWSYLDENELIKYFDNGKHLIGSCSFYDHLLCIWKSNYELVDR